MTVDNGFDGVWPALFAQLSPAQRCAVVDTLASGWHEGWAPTRDDIESLQLLVNGSVDCEQYLARVLGTGQRQARRPGHRSDGARIDLTGRSTTLPA